MPPVVPGISTDPEFIKLRDRALAQPSLGDALNVINTDSGFYGAIGDKPMRIRSTIALLLLEDAFANATAVPGWTPESDETRDPGTVAAEVLSAALQGIPDESLGTWVLPDGGTVQKAVATTMTVYNALDLLNQIDANAARIVASGASSAAAQWSAAYHDALWSGFRQRFSDVIESVTSAPFSWLPGGPTPWLFAGGALILWRMLAVRRAD